MWNVNLVMYPYDQISVIQNNFFSDWSAKITAEKHCFIKISYSFFDINITIFSFI